MTAALFLVCAVVAVESLHSIIDTRFSYAALVLAILTAILILAGVFT